MVETSLKLIPIWLFNLDNCQEIAVFTILTLNSACLMILAAYPAQGFFIHSQVGSNMF